MGVPLRFAANDNLANGRWPHNAQEIPPCIHLPFGQQKKSNQCNANFLVSSMTIGKLREDVEVSQPTPGQVRTGIQFLEDFGFRVVQDPEPGLEGDMSLTKKCMARFEG